MPEPLDVIVTLMEKLHRTNMMSTIKDDRTSEIISDTLVEIQSSLVRCTAPGWPVELQDLTQSFTNEVKRLQDLILRLENQVDGKLEGSDSSSERGFPLALDKDFSSGADGKSRSTSDLKLAHWATTPLHLGLVESRHPAVYVLVGEVGHYDSKPTTNDETCSPVEISQELPVGRYELPDVIVMTSMRLLTYIDYKIYDGSLQWTEKEECKVHFTILRPFKILVFFDEEIRNHVVELEQRRRLIKSMTEDEYEEDWRSHPPLDGRSELETSNKTVPELTGLIKDFRALIKFMDHYITPAISRNLDEKVYFSELWYSFPTGSLIYVKDKKIRQKVWRVIQRTGGRYWRRDLTSGRRHSVSRKASQFVIDCYYTDFDGNRYFPVYHRILIDPFDGLESLAGLPACPLQAAVARGNIDLEVMVNRGREFLECTRPTHRDYTGRNQLHQPDGEELMRGDSVIPENVSCYSEWIDSEVMVDIERALHAVPNWRPRTSEFRAFKDESGPDLFTDTDVDNLWDRKSTERFINSETEKWQKWDWDHPPTEWEDLVLLPGRIYAFVFRTRKWGMNDFHDAYSEHS